MKEPGKIEEYPAGYTSSIFRGYFYNGEIHFGSNKRDAMNYTSIDTCLWLKGMEGSFSIEFYFMDGLAYPIFGFQRSR